MSSKLTEALDELVQSKTFSLEGITAIQALKAKAVAMEQELANKGEAIVSLQQGIASRDEQISKLQAREAAVVGREVAVTTREAKITDLEKETAVYKAESIVTQRCFETIFRNRIVREVIQTDVPVPMASSNNSGSWISREKSSKEVTREEA